MTETDNLFFELIRVAIGTQESLSRLPKAGEWGELYKMANKQSLIGVCFAGLQRLGADADEGFARIGMSEMQYLTWMGVTANIQRKNEAVDEQCVALQKRLSADGFRSCILKGQGVGQLYTSHSTNSGQADSSAQVPSNLLGLRQSGDIDIYVDCGMEKALAYAREKFGDVEYDYINAHVPVFDTSAGSKTATEVELHWRVQALTNIFANRRLQKWLESEDVKKKIIGWKAKLANGSELVVPSAEFNAFYILLHCYHHMFESGLGLRQLMDYYFVLQAVGREGMDCKESVVALFEEFGMKKFASGVMWIMKEVFGLPDEMMLCGASEKEGRFLLEEVMQNGNFGHHDERIKKVGSGKMSELWRNVQHNWHLASHYPAELIWQPVWLVYHFCWKRFGKH